MSKAVAKNLDGPVIRKIRCLRGMTQAKLAARSNRVGWDVGENISAKIEAQIHCVTDREIVHLAKVLGITVQDFFRIAMILGNTCALARSGGRPFTSQAAT